MTQAYPVVHESISYRPGHRLPALDGLRGVAILLILTSHLFQFAVERPATPVGRLAYDTVMTGWIGVDLFFVLSGFLITGILRHTKSSPRYFRNFFARRTLRIFPLYFAALAVTTVLLPAILPQDVRVQIWAQQSPWYWTYAANVAVALRGWNPTSTQGLDHFWSLAVEEQFYVLWPLAVWFLRRRTLIRLCAACGLVSIGVRLVLHSLGHVEAAFVLMPARMDALAAGALVALVAESQEDFRRIQAGAAPIACVGAAMMAIMIVTRGGFILEDRVIQSVGYTIIAVIFAMLLVGAMSSPRLTTALANAPLRFFGQYSYGLYVIHVPLLLLIPPATFSVLIRTTGASETFARVAGLGVFTAMCVALAVAIFHAYERPFLRLKDRFEAADAPAIPASVDAWPADLPNVART
jgi:peptidoglycan/LPS O-acetylase OafA/YrhL